MNGFLALAVVVSFAAILARMGMTARFRETVVRAKRCLEVLRDPTLDDDTKETTLRRESVRLFGLSGVFAGGAVLALAVPLLGVWLLDRAGVASFDGVLSVLGRADFLIAVALGGLVLGLAMRRVLWP